MNELRLLGMYDIIVVCLGGGAPYRCVISHRRGIPPTGDEWEWIQHFEGVSEEEARRLVAAGRTIYLEEAGGKPWAILIVNDAPVMVVREATDMGAIFGQLK